MNWTQHESGISWCAGVRDDGSGYHVLQLQQGRCFLGWWAWPTERHFVSNRQRHCMDPLYDGASKDAAIEACEAHRKQRLDDEPKSQLAEYFDEWVPADEH